VISAAAQAPHTLGGGVPLLRLDAGMLNPDAPDRVVLALGVAAGWTPAGPNTFLLRYLHQSRNTSAGLYVYDRARQFVLLEWERSFGGSEPYKPQVVARGGAGLLFSYNWPTATTLSGGVALRYPVAPELALAANLEDHVAILPHHSCVTSGSGGTVCATPPFGGWQHNFALLATLEWWPGTPRFPMAARPRPVEQSLPSPAPANAQPGAVCGRLRAARGRPVRVSTLIVGPAGVLVSRASSDIGPLVRCEGGAIVLGPFPGQESPQLVLPESEVTRAWVRGDHRFLGTLVGTGAGAIIGYAFGSAKSYLCDGQPCAKHQGSSTLIGAAIGGALGRMLGQASPRWIQRYP
jgi:YmgG-like glycine-zipper protein